MDVEKTHTISYCVLMLATGHACGMSGSLWGLCVALIAVVPLSPERAVVDDTFIVQSVISGLHEASQSFSCQDLDRIKIQQWLIGRAHHQTCIMDLITDSSVLAALVLCCHSVMLGCTLED